MTLTELLAALSNLDEAPAVEFDPTQIVGDLKDKVDAIKKVLVRLELEHGRLLGLQCEIGKAAGQVGRNIDRLEDYLAFAMRSQGFDKLPGTMWRVQFQNSAPALEVERDATADDLIETPALVSRTVKYAWKKDEIKSYIAAGNTFQHGKIVQGQHLRFYINKEGSK